ncbi:MAG: type II toxin-antitoxin system HicB family antitoxin [Ignavibacteriae bacterium]|nr:type II toxin-antitoxin system HicB family antitoxin [Ignavibacteriota bacterium]
MKKLKEFLQYEYPVRVFKYPDGNYCAEIESIEGLCAYGKTAQEAMRELESVKETAFELMLEQGVEQPVPTIRLEIPVNVFQKISNRIRLQEYIKV